MYKKTLNKHFKDYHKNIEKKLRNLKNTSPKDYWSLLNKYSGGKKEILNKISLETFYEHFKNLNIDNNSNSDSNGFDINSVSEYNVLLNEHFKIGEIEIAIKKLKKIIKQAHQ